MGGSLTHGNVPWEVVRTSRIVETYSWGHYFMYQRRAKVSAAGVRQPQAFLQVTQDYLEKWSKRDRELEKVTLLTSQGQESTPLASAAEARVEDLQLSRQREVRKEEVEFDKMKAE